VGGKKGKRRDRWRDARSGKKLLGGSPSKWIIIGRNERYNGSRWKAETERENEKKGG